MMERIRAVLWGLGQAHWTRHHDADQALRDLDERDHRDQEALERLRQDAEAMRRRLRIIEARQNMQQRRTDA